MKLNLHQKKYLPVFLVFILLSIFYFLTSKITFAAEIFIKSETQEIKAGEHFEVVLSIDTENEDINAVEGVIMFPPESLELKEIKDGGSIINLWVERPKMETNGMIVFSGIIPGGYKNEKGSIMSLIFEAKREGSGSINISNASVLKNDGKGTETKTKISDLEFKILKSEIEISPAESETSIDTNPPESFKPEIARSSDIFDGKWFVVFATQDKGSGIGHYEISEGAGGKFAIAESPHLLKNQKLNRKIAIKSVDKNGNERVEIIYPLNWSPWYENYWIIGIIVLGILIGWIIRVKRN
ncbi:MAG: hypothetical protein HW401_653 [Parcubacteria group bacterium]|nr:hypothetical protein [Parcubacteria group bacterium]